LGDQEVLLDKGKAWKPKTQERPVVHQGEFPIDKAVVYFQ
jgi:hypothetical protein